jgi:Uma2 family endonuclease
MAKAAPKHWTIQDFLAWDDGTDRRHELVAGEIFAMAPPSEVHGTVVINLGAAIRGRLRPPCRVVAEAGIVLPDRDDTFYQADLAVSCVPVDPARHHVGEPVLIVEVLSPSTAVHDRGRKLDDYCRLASVREVLLVSSEERRVQHRRRDGERWLVENLIGDAELRLEVIDGSLALVYEGSGI